MASSRATNAADRELTEDGANLERSLHRLAVSMTAVTLDQARNLMPCPRLIRAAAPAKLFQYQKRSRTACSLDRHGDVWTSTAV